MALIDAEQDDRALLDAEDAAIRAAEQRKHTPAPVDGGTVTADPGTPLAELIGWMRDEGSANSASEGG